MFRAGSRRRQLPPQRGAVADGNDATIGAGFIEMADIAVKHWADVGPIDLLPIPII